MKVAFTTADVQPRDRLDFWHSVTRDRIADHESSALASDNFAAELAVGNVGWLDLVRSSHSGLRVVTTPRQAAGANPDELLLFCPLAGQIRLEQKDRQVSLRPGALAWVDPRLPRTIEFRDEPRTLIVKVPRSELKVRLGTRFDIAGRCITPVSARNRLAMTFVASLADLSGTLDTFGEQLIARQALDLLALAMGEADDRHPRVDNNASLVWRIQCAIDAELDDPDLDPHRIAGRVGLGVRQVNKVLAQQGSSIMRLVLARRLTRCRSALEDPRQAHRAIGDIALSWGFSDLTHFSRSFRRAFGMLPREARLPNRGCG